MGWNDDMVVAQGSAEAATLPVPRGSWGTADPEVRVPELPRMQAGPNMGTQPQGRPASGVWDAMLAGWQGSGPGLIARGKLPDIVLDRAQSKWYERAVAGITQIGVEIPEMVIGSALGGVAGTAGGTAIGGPVGGVIGGVAGTGAGMFAVPGMIREALIQAYQGGEVQSAADFLHRTSIVLKTGAKEAAIGAATAGAGAVAARTVGTVLAPMAADIGVKTATRAIGAADTAAQIGTMIVTPAALEGRLPEPQEFLDAAIVIGGMKAAGAIAPRLADIYARTGKTPAEVLVDANRSPALKEALADPAKADIPAEYKPIADAERAALIVPGEKAAQVAVSPFADKLPQAAGEPALPTHVNYNRINTTEDAKLAMARLSEVYEAEIQTQRRGAVSWQQTEAEAGQILTDMLGAPIQPRAPGTPAGAAELLARKQLLAGAAEDMMAARDALLVKGAEATPADTAAFLMAIERNAMIQAEFLGARAEAGRALNILKSTAVEAERAKLVQEVVSTWGKDPLKLAEALKQIDTPEGALKFAREAVKATSWEKFVEAWKAGILSGPVTHVANLLGNGTFAVLQVPLDAMSAGLGRLRGASPGERASFAEPFGRLIGLVEGVKDGLRVAAAAIKTEDALQAGKAEQHRHAIEGKKGEIIRLPFRFLSAEDAIFRTMNERGEAYTLAVRQAAGEGLNPLTREFRARVAELVQNPTAKMAEQIAAAGERLTFNAKLGEAGAKLQMAINAPLVGGVAPLQVLIPFVRTPANIAKELLAISPLATLTPRFWNALKEGGPARDRAIAGVLFGTATMAMVMQYFDEGVISGQGDPDPGKRRAQMASGWQPYSVKIGNTWYSYQRLQPLGTLIGMAADAAAVSDHMTEEEADKVPKMLSVAFANAITNQTFLQGITNIIGAISEPTQKGARFVQGLVGSLVPNIIAQPTAMADPLAREIDSILDAIKSRLPVARGTLLPKRDIFGEPIAGTERALGVLPITRKEVSQDKVRSEAARIGFSAADTPKKTHIGSGTGKLGEVKLTPEERDVFADVGGHMAYNILKPIVESPTWDELPQLVKIQTYRKVFSAAHEAAAFQAIPMDKRLQLQQEIVEKFTQKIAPEGPK